MSTANIQTRHKLDVTRTLDGFESALIKHLKPAAAQELLFPDRGIYAGRCMSRNSAGESELGCSGRRVPYWIIRTSNLPSTGSFSSPVPIEQEVGLTVQDGAEHVVLHYAGIEGLEIATTEFLPAATTGVAWAINQLVAAPTSAVVGGSDAAKLAAAGVVTNAATVLHGRSAIVGVVSDVTLLTDMPHGVPMIQLYTLYRPPLEGVPAGVPTT